MNKFSWLVASLAAVVVLACASQKAPAEQAVAKIDNRLNAIHDAAVKYAPEELQGVQAQVSGLRQRLAKGDYQGVIAAAPAVNSAISDLRKDVDAKQSAADAAAAQTKQQWRNLNAEVPKMVAELHSQVDTLSKARKLPKGVSKTSLQAAKDGVTSVDSMWNDANNALSNQDYAGAVAKGQAAKDKATELMHSLGLKPS